MQFDTDISIRDKIVAEYNKFSLKLNGGSTLNQIHPDTSLANIKITDYRNKPLGYPNKVPLTGPISIKDVFHGKSWSIGWLPILDLDVISSTTWTSGNTNSFGGDAIVTGGDDDELGILNKKTKNGLIKTSYNRDVFIEQLKFPHPLYLQNSSSYDDQKYFLIGSKDVTGYDAISGCSSFVVDKIRYRTNDKADFNDYKVDIKNTKHIYDYHGNTSGEALVYRMDDLSGAKKTHGTTFSSGFYGNSAITSIWLPGLNNYSTGTNTITGYHKFEFENHVWDNLTFGRVSTNLGSNQYASGKPWLVFNNKLGYPSDSARLTSPDGLLFISGNTKITGNQYNIKYDLNGWAKQYPIGGDSGVTGIVPWRLVLNSPEPKRFVSFDIGCPDINGTTSNSGCWVPIAWKIYGTNTYPGRNTDDKYENLTLANSTSATTDTNIIGYDSISGSTEFTGMRVYKFNEGVSTITGFNYENFDILHSTNEYVCQVPSAATIMLVDGSSVVVTGNIIQDYNNIDANLTVSTVKDLELELASTKNIVKYRISSYTQHVNAPSSWTLKGSLNGTTGWVEIDNRKNKDSTYWDNGGGTDGTLHGFAYRDFFIANPEYYQYYKFEFKEDVNISKINLFDLKEIPVITQVDGDTRITLSSEIKNINDDDKLIFHKPLPINKLNNDWDVLYNNTDYPFIYQQAGKWGEGFKLNKFNHYSWYIIEILKFGFVDYGNRFGPVGYWMVTGNNDQIGATSTWKEPGTTTTTGLIDFEDYNNFVFGGIRFYERKQGSKIITYDFYGDNWNGKKEEFQQKLYEYGFTYNLPSYSTISSSDKYDSTTTLTGFDNPTKYPMIHSHGVSDNEISIEKDLSSFANGTISLKISNCTTSSILLYDHDNGYYKTLKSLVSPTLSDGASKTAEEYNGLDIYGPYSYRTGDKIKISGTNTITNIIGLNWIKIKEDNWSSFYNPGGNMGITSTGTHFITSTPSGMSKYPHAEGLAYNTGFYFEIQCSSGSSGFEWDLTKNISMSLSWKEDGGPESNDILTANINRNYADGMFSTTGNQTEMPIGSVTWLNNDISGVRLTSNTDTNFDYKNTYLFEPIYLDYSGKLDQVKDLWGKEYSDVITGWQDEHGLLGKIYGLTGTNITSGADAFGTALISALNNDDYDSAVLADFELSVSGIDEVNHVHVYKANLDLASIAFGSAVGVDGVDGVTGGTGDFVVGVSNLTLSGWQGGIVPKVSLKSWKENAFTHLTGIHDITKFGFAFFGGHGETGITTSSTTNVTGWGNWYGVGTDGATTLLYNEKATRRRKISWDSEAGFAPISGWTGETSSAYNYNYANYDRDLIPAIDDPGGSQITFGSNLFSDTHYQFTSASTILTEIHVLGDSHVTSIQNSIDSYFDSINATTLTPDWDNFLGALFTVTGINSETDSVSFSQWYDYSGVTNITWAKDDSIQEWTNASSTALPAFEGTSMVTFVPVPDAGFTGISGPDYNTWISDYGVKYPDTHSMYVSDASTTMRLPISESTGHRAYYVKQYENYDNSAEPITVQITELATSLAAWENHEGIAPLFDGTSVWGYDNFGDGSTINTGDIISTNNLAGNTFLMNIYDWNNGPDTTPDNYGGFQGAAVSGVLPPVIDSATNAINTQSDHVYYNNFGNQEAHLASTYIPLLATHTITELLPIVMSTTLGNDDISSSSTDYIGHASAFAGVHPTTFLNLHDGTTNVTGIFSNAGTTNNTGRYGWSFTQINLYSLNSLNSGGTVLTTDGFNAATTIGPSQLLNDNGGDEHNYNFAQPNNNWLKPGVDDSGDYIADPVQAGDIDINEWAGGINLNAGDLVPVTDYTINATDYEHFAYDSPLGSIAIAFASSYSNVDDFKDALQEMTGQTDATGWTINSGQDQDLNWNKIVWPYQYQYEYQHGESPSIDIEGLKKFGSVGEINVTGDPAADSHLAKFVESEGVIAPFAGSTSLAIDGSILEFPSGVPYPYQEYNFQFDHLDSTSLIPSYFHHSQYESNHKMAGLVAGRVPHKVVDASTADYFNIVNLYNMGAKNLLGVQYGTSHETHLDTTTGNTLITHVSKYRWEKLAMNDEGQWSTSKDTVRDYSRADKFVVEEGTGHQEDSTGFQIQASNNITGFETWYVNNLGEGNDAEEMWELYPDGLDSLNDFVVEDTVATFNSTTVDLSNIVGTSEVTTTGRQQIGDVNNLFNDSGESNGIWDRSFEATGGDTTGAESIGILHYETKTLLHKVTYEENQRQTTYETQTVGVQGTTLHRQTPVEQNQEHQVHLRHVSRSRRQTGWRDRSRGQQQNGWGGRHRSQHQRFYRRRGQEYRDQQTQQRHEARLPGQHEQITRQDASVRVEASARARTFEETFQHDYDVNDHKWEDVTVFHHFELGETEWYYEDHISYVKQYEEGNVKIDYDLKPIHATSHIEKLYNLDTTKADQQVIIQDEKCVKIDSITIDKTKATATDGVIGSTELPTITKFAYIIHSEDHKDGIIHYHDDPDELENTGATTVEGLGSITGGFVPMSSFDYMGGTSVTGINDMLGITTVTHHVGDATTLQGVLAVTGAATGMYYFDEPYEKSILPYVELHIDSILGTNMKPTTFITGIDLVETDLTKDMGYVYTYYDGDTTTIGSEYTVHKFVYNYVHNFDNQTLYTFKVPEKEIKCDILIVGGGGSGGYGEYAGGGGGGGVVMAEGITFTSGSYEIGVGAGSKDSHIVSKVSDNLKINTGDAITTFTTIIAPAGGAGGSGGSGGSGGGGSGGSGGSLTNRGDAQYYEGTSMVTFSGYHNISGCDNITAYGNSGGGKVVSGRTLGGGGGGGAGGKGKDGYWDYWSSSDIDGYLAVSGGGGDGGLGITSNIETGELLYYGGGGAGTSGGPHIFPSFRGGLGGGGNSQSKISVPAPKLIFYDFSEIGLDIGENQGSSTVTDGIFANWCNDNEFTSDLSLATTSTSFVENKYPYPLMWKPGGTGSIQKTLPNYNGIVEVRYGRNSTYNQTTNFVTISLDTEVMARSGQLDKTVSFTFTPNQVLKIQEEDATVLTMYHIKIVEKKDTDRFSDFGELGRIFSEAYHPVMSDWNGQTNGTGFTRTLSGNDGTTFDDWTYGLQHGDHGYQNDFTSLHIGEPQGTAISNTYPYPVLWKTSTAGIFYTYPYLPDYEGQGLMEVRYGQAQTNASTSTYAKVNLYVSGSGWKIVDLTNNQLDRTIRFKFNSTNDVLKFEHDAGTGSPNPKLVIYHIKMEELDSDNIFYDFGEISRAISYPGDPIDDSNDIDSDPSIFEQWCNNNGFSNYYINSVYAQNPGYGATVTYPYPVIFHSWTVSAGYIEKTLPNYYGIVEIRYGAYSTIDDVSILLDSVEMDKTTDLDKTVIFTFTPNQLLKVQEEASPLVMYHIKITRIDCKDCKEHGKDGKGGGGGARQSAPAIEGGSGLVVIRYKTSEVAEKFV